MMSFYSLSMQLAQRHQSLLRTILHACCAAQPSKWERSTEEDRNQIEGLQAAFKEADKDGWVLCFAADTSFELAFVVHEWTLI